MKEWFDDKDKTRPIITAKKHLKSSHGTKSDIKLPEVCIIYEMGKAIEYIENNYNTSVLFEQLPCFLEKPKCIKVNSIPNVCFVKGGYGAPSAVDTLETILELGVKKVVIAGLCGVFDKDTNVGDVIIPPKVIREEGTSYHYIKDGVLSKPDDTMLIHAYRFFATRFNVFKKMTVSTDSVYRQTLKKEEYWRNLGAIGIDMEISALLGVSTYYNIPSVAILLASDKHPVNDNDIDWEWGSIDYEKKRFEFIDSFVEYSKHLGI